MLFAIISFLIWMLAVLAALTVHEFAHALIADHLGDPTARAYGRLSLNPISHWDPVGTTMLFATAAMAAFGAPVIPFGWAKPVMFDPYNLNNPKRDAALIAFGGPAVNLIAAVGMSLLFQTFLMEIPFINVISVAFITVNVSLAIFNLLPVHPLDGSKILYGLLPPGLAHEYNMVLSRYGTLILIFLIIPWGGTSPLSALITPVIRTILNLLISV